MAEEKHLAQFQRISLFLLRVSLGWLFFYSGIIKIMNPNWSAAGYLKSAGTFPWLYSWLASPSLLPYVNFINEWGLVVVGLSLLLGFGVRYSAPIAATLMLLYYLPGLDFPHPDPNTYLVDQHIIYIFALMTLAAFRAGKYWGLDKK